MRIEPPDRFSHVIRQARVAGWQLKVWSVLASWHSDEPDGDTSLLQRALHDFGLLDWHNGILVPVNQEHGPQVKTARCVSRSISRRVREIVE